MPSREEVAPVLGDKMNRRANWGLAKGFGMSKWGPNDYNKTTIGGRYARRRFLYVLHAWLDRDPTMRLFPRFMNNDSQARVAKKNKYEYQAMVSSIN